MSKYLISTTENYRVDDADEAKNIIEEAKADPSFILSKYNCVKKLTSGINLVLLKFLPMKKSRLFRPK